MDSSSLFPITKKLNDDANERNSYQKRLLFKANDYLCKQNNKRSLLMQKHATESTSLVSKSLPVQFVSQGNFFFINQIHFKSYLLLSLLTFRIAFMGRDYGLQAACTNFREIINPQKTVIKIARSCKVELFETHLCTELYR